MSTTLRGGTAPTVAAGAAPLNATNGSFHYDGDDYAVALGSASTYAAIATVIQTAIAANLTGATFTYDTASGRFLLTRPDATAGDAFFGPHSAGTGTAIETALGMAQASNPLHLQGHDAEDPDAAWAEINRVVTGRQPVLAMRDEGTPDTFGGADTDDALKAFAQTIKAIYMTRSTTMAPIEDAFDNQQHHVGSWLTDAGELPDVGAAARLSAVDYDGAATQISLHGKALVNVAPTEIDDTDFADLQAIRGNIYTTVDGNPSAIDGFTGNTNYYLDEAYGSHLAGEHARGGPVDRAAQLAPAHAGVGCCGRSTRPSRRPCSTGSSRRAWRSAKRRRRTSGAPRAISPLAPVTRAHGFSSTASWCGSGRWPADRPHGRHGQPAARRSTGPAAT